MTTLEKLAREIKNMADKQEHFYIGSPARISALMDVVMQWEKALRLGTSIVGHPEAAEGCRLLVAHNKEALAYAEERIKEVMG